MRMDVEFVGREEVCVKAGILMFQEGEDERIDFCTGGRVAGQEG